MPLVQFFGCLGRHIRYLRPNASLKPGSLTDRNAGIRKATKGTGLISLEKDLDDDLMPLNQAPSLIYSHNEVSALERDVLRNAHADNLSGSCPTPSSNVECVFDESTQVL